MAWWLLSIGLFGVVLGAREDDSGDDLLPRPVRKVRKAREDQGLPEDAELEELAREYLKYAHAAWPELVKSGVLPQASPSTIAAMVENFKERHRTGKIDVKAIARLQTIGLLVAANYPRYSDKNSQPKSIPDQVRLAIACAKGRGFFIPWELIVADYARRASWGRRQGYENLLKMIRQTEFKLSAVIIDAFDRGSRNEPEAWKLAGMCKNLKIGLYGASDGFHIDDANWDMTVSMMNMFNRMEHKSKSQRVRRGLSGLAAENRPIGRLPFGFARRPLRDAAGGVLLKPDGHPKTERCFDPAGKVAVELAFDLFVNKKWSPYKIAVEFNRRLIDGVDNWSDVGIDKMLTNPAYIGLFIWNRTSKVFDWETQSYQTVNNPWYEWVCFYDRSLAIIPKKWHVLARNKLVKSRKDGSKKKRKKPERVSATLLSGTLVCGYCGRELTLCRSTFKYKALHCPNGLFEKHGCQLKSSKSTRILEQGVLDFVKQAILDPESLKELVIAANERLTIEAARPRQDERPLRARAKKLRADIDRLVDRVQAANNELVIETYEQKIVSLKEQLHITTKELAGLARANQPVPPPLDLARIETYLTDLRGLLAQEIPAAAEALRALTGPIVVTQQDASQRTKPGACWLLKFTPQVMPLLCETALSLDYPDSPTLEFLSAGKWITPKPVEITAEDVAWHRSEASADAYKRASDMLRGNASVREIVQATGCGRTTVYRIKERLAQSEMMPSKR